MYLKKLCDVDTRDTDYFTSILAHIQTQDEKGARDKDKVIAATHICFALCGSAPSHKQGQ